MSCGRLTGRAQLSPEIGGLNEHGWDVAGITAIPRVGDHSGVTST